MPRPHKKKGQCRRCWVCGIQAVVLDPTVGRLCLFHLQEHRAIQKRLQAMRNAPGLKPIYTPPRVIVHGPRFDS